MPGHLEVGSEHLRNYALCAMHDAPPRRDDYISADGVFFLHRPTTHNSARMNYEGFGGGRDSISITAADAQRIGACVRHSEDKDERRRRGGVFQEDARPPARPAFLEFS